jgi:hypothetical protein
LEEDHQPFSPYSQPVFVRWARACHNGPRRAIGNKADGRAATPVFPQVISC